MTLKVLNTDDEVTKEIKEDVIKVFVDADVLDAAGVQETGFNRSTMMNYLLGLVQAGRLPGVPP